MRGRQFEIGRRSRVRIAELIEATERVGLSVAVDHRVAANPVAQRERAVHEKAGRSQCRIDARIVEDRDHEVSACDVGGSCQVYVNALEVCFVGDAALFLMGGCVPSPGQHHAVRTRKRDTRLEKGRAGEADLVVPDAELTGRRVLPDPPGEPHADRQVPVPPPTIVWVTTTGVAAAVADTPTPSNIDTHTTTGRVFVTLRMFPPDNDPHRLPVRGRFCESPGRSSPAACATIER